MTISTLPTLSYTTLKTDPTLFEKQLQEALSGTGFLYLDSIGAVIPEWESAWTAAFDAAEGFFALSEEEKNRIHISHSRHFRGFSGFKSETTQGKQDLREQIDLGPDSTPIVPYPPSPSEPIELSLYGPNLYPDSSLPNFSAIIKTYRAHCQTIAHDLLLRVAGSLTPHPELIVDPFLTDDEKRPDYSRMKIARYPPSEGAEGLGVGAHRDGGGLTLLAQDSTGGLQVQLWNGEWIGVTPKKFALVINVGQVIERLSAHAYPATTHRVLPTISPTPRYSIPFFFCPGLSSILTPLTPSQLHPELYERAVARSEVVSAVKKGDLHEEVFGRAAWRGMSRSQAKVWEKFYGDWDTLGGPEKVLETAGGVQVVV